MPSSPCARRASRWSRTSARCSACRASWATAPRASSSSPAGDIDAARAREILLVNEVLADADALHARARELAAEIAAHSPLAVQGAKQVLGFAERRETEAALDYVAVWNAAFLHSDDLGEAVAAFTERRKPEFRGR